MLCNIYIRTHKSKKNIANLNNKIRRIKNHLPTPEENMELVLWLCKCTRTHKTKESFRLCPPVVFLEWNGLFLLLFLLEKGKNELLTGRVQICCNSSLKIRVWIVCVGIVWWIIYENNRQWKWTRLLLLAASFTLSNLVYDIPPSKTQSHFSSFY